MKFDKMKVQLLRSAKKKKLQKHSAKTQNTTKQCCK